jgi:hypothetical protein
MPNSKYKIIKDCWGTRTNFQASYGLKMTPEDLEVGDSILEAMQSYDATRSHQDPERRPQVIRPRGTGLPEREPESDWVRGNRERYEAGGRSLLKEYAAHEAVMEHGFTPTGDPEMDLIIAMGLGDMEDMEDDPEPRRIPNPHRASGSSNSTGGASGAPPERESKRRINLGRQREDDPELCHVANLQGTASSSNSAGGAGEALPEGKMSKRQMKLERQREGARRFNAQRFSG